jgi:hypothetical protein
MARDDQFRLKTLLDRGFVHHHLEIEGRVRQSSSIAPTNKENRNDDG